MIWEKTKYLRAMWLKIQLNHFCSLPEEYKIAYIIVLKCSSIITIPENINKVALIVPQPLLKKSHNSLFIHIKGAF